ncbi:MAG: hypothetical protein ABFS34_14330 [Gemmatimonadota bacterium]
MRTLDNAERTSRLRFAALILGWATLAFAATGLSAQDTVEDAVDDAIEAVETAVAQSAQDATEDVAAALNEVADQTARRLVAYSTDLDSDEAELTLEFAGGREIAFALGEERVWVDGRRIGTYDEGGALDRSWRALLRGLDGPAGEVAQQIIAWEPTGEGVEQAFDDALEDFLSGAAGAEAYGTRPAIEVLDGAGDSVVRLNVRLQELELAVEDLEGTRERLRAENRQAQDWARSYRGPFHSVRRGIAGILATLLKYALLIGIGWAIVYFGGRPYLETIADAARNQPVRSWAVGFAGGFLLLPAFVIGCLVLAVSIVGIPALLLWLPGFPIVVMLAAILGFLGVAHGVGEMLAERRFRGGEWFQRANSYYYVMTGVGALLVLPLAGHAVRMVGFLGPLVALLHFLGVVAIWLAATIGFGAVLTTRAGSVQPDGSKTQRAKAEPAEADNDAEPVVESFDV